MSSETIPPPDWDHWSRPHRIKLWRAVALSLNMDPFYFDKHYPDTTEGRAQIYNLFRSELIDRNEQKRLYYGSDELKELGVDEGSRGPYAEINLVDFAHMVKDAGWKVPQELEEIAKNNKRKPVELHPTEKKKLLAFVRAFDLEQDLPPEPYKAAPIVVRLMKGRGIDPPGERTIAERLKEAREEYPGKPGSGKS